jgi:hypothetical protein
MNVEVQYVYAQQDGPDRIQGGMSVRVRRSLNVCGVVLSYRSDYVIIDVAILQDSGEAGEAQRSYTFRQPDVIGMADSLCRLREPSLLGLLMIDVLDRKLMPHDWLFSDIARNYLWPQR